MKTDKTKLCESWWMLTLLFATLIAACGKQPNNNGNNKIVVNSEKFTLPTVPAALQSPEQRAAYVVAHYWDNLNFADTSLIAKPEILEQAFVDYITLFTHTSPYVVESSIAAMLNRATEGDNRAMCDHFAKLYEKYLDDPNSPFRHEEYYILVLQSIVANSKIDEQHKIRTRYRLETALKNRPGSVATDFELTLKNGRTMKLSEVNSPYTILFFNNPDCHDCERVKELLLQISHHDVKVVATYPDEDIKLWQQTNYPTAWIDGRSGSELQEQRLYDLRAIPCLYLLDREKRVVLKDASAEAVIDWLKGNL